MAIGSLLQKLLMRRLLRYRFAWFAFGLLSLYIAGIIGVVVVSSHREHATGTPAACSAQQDSSGQTSILFTLRGEPKTWYQIAPDMFRPVVPVSVCEAQLFDFTYETNILRDPFKVDGLVAISSTHRKVTYVSIAGQIYTQVQTVQLIGGAGGMLMVGIIMFAVGVFWSQVGDLARRVQLTTRSARLARNMPQEFLAHVTRDIDWLEALPWGTSCAQDADGGVVRFQRGVALVRGWGGDPAHLMEGVHQLIQCPAVYAHTGAAEVALQLGAHELGAYAPDALAAARRHCWSAIMLAPDSADARITYVHVLAGLSAQDKTALQQAEELLTTLRQAAPHHPRLPSAAAAILIAEGRWSAAITWLKRALALAPSQEEAQAILDQLAFVTLRARNLRQALKVFVELNLPAPAADDIGLTPARKRLRELGSTP